jgi:hypothetical protein
LQAKDVAQIDVRLSTVDKAHWKSLLQLTTLSVPDQSLNRETSEIQQVETLCLDASPEGVFSTSETTPCQILFLCTSALYLYHLDTLNLFMYLFIYTFKESSIQMVH